MKHIVLLLFFLVACSPGATITETWPDGYPQETPEPEKREYVELQPDPIRATNFSLVQGEEVTFIYNGTEHTMLLFEVTQNRSRMRVDDVAFRVDVNQTVIRSGVPLKVLEVANDVVPVPRKSFVDISVGGNRAELFVGEAVTVNNATAAIDFIGLQDSIPKVRIMVGQQSEILAEKEEHYFDEFFVFVHGVYFNDATEFDLVDAITVQVG